MTDAGNASRSGEFMVRARLRREKLKAKLRAQRGGHRSLDDVGDMEYLLKRTYYALRDSWRRFRRRRNKARDMEERGSSRYSPRHER